MIIFHPKNVGREIVLVSGIVGGIADTISYIIGSKARFRITSEKNSSVVNDYGIKDIQSASVLTVSFDGGETWMDISVQGQ